MMQRSTSHFCRIINCRLFIAPARASSEKTCRSMKLNNHHNYHCQQQQLIITAADTVRKFIRHNIHTHIHLFNGPFSGNTRLSWYQKCKTNLDFTEVRDSEWQWHQMGRMQVCTSLQTDNHASTPPLSFLQAGCLSCRPTNSIKALKAICSPQRQCKYNI